MKIIKHTYTYDATNHRFTQLDPIKDGDNWYAYVGNNPVNMVDPLGLYFINKITDKDGNVHFEAQKQSEVDAVIQSLIYRGSPQTLINSAFGKETVGGNSYKDFDQEAYIQDVMLQEIQTYVNQTVVPQATAVHPYLGVAVSVINNLGSTIVTLATDGRENLGVAKRDDVIWKIANDAGITMQGSSKDTLEQKMALVDEFVKLTSWLHTSKLTDIKKTPCDAGKWIAIGDERKIKQIKIDLKSYYYESFVVGAAYEYWGGKVSLPYITMVNYRALLKNKDIADLADAKFNKFMEDVLSGLENQYWNTIRYFEEIFCNTK